MYRLAFLTLFTSFISHAQSSHLFTSVSGNGKTTVIFESGMAGTHDEWDHYVDTLQQIARVFTYDRAGIGQSDSAIHPRTIPYMVEELRMELKRQGIPPPYILVGHSMGSYISRYFALLYPDEVIAIVLIDPSPNRLYDEYTETEMEDFIRFGNEAMSHSSSGDVAEWKSYLSNRHYLRDVRTSNEIPIVVFSATQWDFWRFHEDFMNSHPESKHIRLEGSHAIHKERSDDILPYIISSIETWSESGIQD